MGSRKKARLSSGACACIRTPSWLRWKGSSPSRPKRRPSGAGIVGGGGGGARCASGAAPAARGNDLAL